MFVLRMKYTLPISTTTPMMTVRMPRNSYIQAPGPPSRLGPAPAARIDITWWTAG